MARPTHPGTIEYIDGNTKEVTRTDRVEDVPDFAAWCETKEGTVPVVLVIAHTEGDRRVIREYGPGGQLLRTTRQMKS